MEDTCALFYTQRLVSTRTFVTISTVLSVKCKLFDKLFRLLMIWEPKTRTRINMRLGHVLMQRYDVLSNNINHEPIQYSCHLWNTIQQKVPNVLCQEYRDL
jgi:hypothetical protein